MYGHLVDLEVKGGDQKRQPHKLHDPCDCRRRLHNPVAALWAVSRQCDVIAMLADS